MFAQLQALFAQLALSKATFGAPNRFWAAFKDYDGTPIDIREHQDAYEFFTRLQVGWFERLQVQSWKSEVCWRHRLSRHARSCVGTAAGQSLSVSLASKLHHKRRSGGRLQKLLQPNACSTVKKHSDLHCCTACWVAAAGFCRPAPHKHQPGACHKGRHGRYLCTASHLQVRGSIHQPPAVSSIPALRYQPTVTSAATVLHCQPRRGAPVALLCKLFWARTGSQGRPWIACACVRCQPPVPPGLITVLTSILLGPHASSLSRVSGSSVWCAGAMTSPVSATRTSIRSVLRSRAWARCRRAWTTM